MDANLESQFRPQFGSSQVFLPKLLVRQELPFKVCANWFYRLCLWNAISNDSLESFEFETEDISNQRSCAVEKTSKS
jgi:hypothetical protein